MNVDLKAGIVRVIGPDGETAGTDDGLVATCAHVVAGSSSGRRRRPRRRASQTE